MKILGIDPGYDRMGVAIVESAKPRERVVYSHCLTTDRKSDYIARLGRLGREVAALIAHHKPDGVAIERLFFSNNQKTATAIAEVRGMLLYIASSHNLALFEYTPLQIKTAIAGYGRADKRQVESMVRALVSLEEKDRLDDEYDAIAIALTCLAHNPHTKSTR